MTDKLSPAFHGCKKFRGPHYDLYQALKNISDEEVADIFAPYTQNISSISSQDGTTTLLPIFAEFIRENLRRFHSWDLEKLSSWI